MDEARSSSPSSSPPRSSSATFRIVDAIYGPVGGEEFPSALAHTLPVELSRRVVSQLETLLAGRPQHASSGSNMVHLKRGSMNAVFGDPAPMVHKELRVAVER